jgi:hypothetical protein
MFNRKLFQKQQMIILFSKIKVCNSYDYHDLTSLIAISKCYSTIEPYIDGQCTVYVRKIGHNYKAFW